MVVADNVASPLALRSWPHSPRRHGSTIGSASQASSASTDPLLLAYGRVVETGRGGFTARDLSQESRETCRRRGSLSREALHSRDSDVREFIAVTLQEIIETGGNKTDANAVWLVMDQMTAWDLVRRIR